MTRYLAIDPGRKRIGIAISDPTGTIARPLTILIHESREKDIAAIINLAKVHAVDVIVMGQALDAMGEAGQKADWSKAFGAEIAEKSGKMVVMWDESHTSQQAIAVTVQINARNRRQKAVDGLAASILLQDYLETKKDEKNNETKTLT